MNKIVLMEQLNNNPISYRSILTIPKNLKIGLEIEVENISFQTLYNLIINQFNDSWEIKKDASLKYGGEIVPPIFYNVKETWVILKKLGELLKKYDTTFSNCSFQINYDALLLRSNKNKIIFLKLFAVYEDIIYRFSKGFDKYYRESLDTYASPIILTLKDYLSTDESTIIKAFSDQKRYGISFKQNDLIEFRIPNGTNNPILWQNYITFFYYLLKYASNSKCNEKELDEYIKNFNIIYLLENYESLKIDKAINLSKKILSKQIDRIFFLHQYVGKDICLLNN